MGVMKQYAIEVHNANGDFGDCERLGCACERCHELWVAHGPAPDEVVPEGVIPWSWVCCPSCGSTAWHAFERYAPDSDECERDPFDYAGEYLGPPYLYFE